jgi:hypothetical protein
MEENVFKSKQNEIRALDQLSTENVLLESLERDRANEALEVRSYS